MNSHSVAIAPRRSIVLFATLSIVMVIASYILLVIVAVLCVYLPGLLIASLESANAQLAILFLGGILIAGAILWSIFPRRDKFEAPGLLLKQAEHPRLFSELHRISSALNEGLPKEVYLMGVPNAFVADRGGILGFGSRRVMAVGLPLLATMPLEEFRAVLAHEFAHYYGGDTRLGPWVYRSQSAMIRVFQNVSKLGEVRAGIFSMMHMLVTKVLEWYFIFFLRVIRFVSRKQEFRADELACLVTGRQAIMDGLKRIEALTVAWPTYWNTAVSPVLRGGCLPAIGDGFKRFLGASAISAQVDKAVQEEITEGKADPFDTHPPLRDRLAALEKMPERGASDEGRGAVELLEDPEALELKFLESVNPSLVEKPLRRVGWDEIGSSVMIPSWRKAVAEYAALFRGFTIGTLPEAAKQLHEIGQQIRDPKGMLLSREQRAERAAQLLSFAVAVALLDHAWELKADPGSCYVYRGDKRMDAWAVVERLASRKMSAEEWVRTSQSLGIFEFPLAAEPGSESTRAASRNENSNQSRMGGERV